MLHVIEIDNLDRLAEYRLVWRSLLLEMPTASFFQRYRWLETYWRYFGKNKHLRVLIAHSGDAPVGILPLELRVEPSRFGPVRVLTYPLDNWGTAFGPIGIQRTATLYAAMRHLRDRRCDWDVLDLRWVDPETDRNRTPRTMAMNDLAPHAQPWMHGAVIDLDGDWDAYLAGRTPKFRENLRRLRRRIEAAGEVVFERYRPQGGLDDGRNPRWDLFETCVEISARSKQARDTNNYVLSHPRIVEFLAELHEIAARDGCVDVNVLRLDGKPIAFTYNYFWDGIVFGLRMGFDPEYAGLGPGTVLRAMMIEDSFRRGDRQIDLGTGYLESKTPWATGRTTSYRYTSFAPTLRGRLLRMQRWFADRFADPLELALRRSA